MMCSLCLDVFNFDVIICAEPQTPEFNLTVASLTSLNVEWSPLMGNFDYFLIELKNSNNLSVSNFKNAVDLSPQILKLPKN